MNHKNALALASLLAIASLVACGGGSTTAPPYVAPTSNPNSGGGGSNATSNVSFYVIVPGGTQTTSKKRRPAFVAPNGTQSVAFTLTSVNGSAANGTPSVASLSGANASCTQGNNEVLCSFTVSAPVGTLIYTVDTYTSTDGSGTPTGEGVIQVVTTAGKTTVANTALGGTVTNLVVVLDGAAELGASAAIPVFVEALDANGYTILGNYTSPLNVTVNDSDSSATSVTNPTQTYTNSTSTSNIELNYSGAAMTAAATIGATATTGALPGTPIPAANITPASFLPDVTAPTVNGASTTFDYTGVSSETDDNGTPVPSPWPAYSGGFTVGVATGQSFNGQSNLIAISGLQVPTLGSPDDFYNYGQYLDDNFTAYFAWTPQGSTTSLGYVGVNDPTLDGSDDPTTITCAAPYSNQLELPFPASWNVLGGSGPCTYFQSFDDGEYGGETIVTNSDGSYSDVVNEFPDYNLYISSTSQSNGGAVASFSCFGTTITVAPPVSGAANQSAMFSYFVPPFDTPPTSTPSPYPISAPNPWLAMAAEGATALSGGTPPNPLESDTFTTVGSIASLPGGCAVGAGIVPASNPSLSEADETIVYADPTADLNANYATTLVKHYYLGGVGEVCNEQNYSSWYIDTEVCCFPGDVLFSWYEDEGYNIGTYDETQWTYVTSTSLSATYARVRSFAQALPATSQAFTAATYAMIHTRARNPKFNVTTTHGSRPQKLPARRAFGSFGR